MNIILISADQLSAFEVVVSQLLEDVQERLVYKAQVIRPTNSICLAFFVLFFFKVKQYSISSKEQKNAITISRLILYLQFFYMLFHSNLL